MIVIKYSPSNLLPPLKCLLNNSQIFCFSHCYKYYVCICIYVPYFIIYFIESRSNNKLQHVKLLSFVNRNIFWRLLVSSTELFTEQQQ